MARFTVEPCRTRFGVEKDTQLRSRHDCFRVPEPLFAFLGFDTSPLRRPRFVVCCDEPRLSGSIGSSTSMLLLFQLEREQAIRSFSAGTPTPAASGSGWTCDSPRQWGDELRIRSEGGGMGLLGFFVGTHAEQDSRLRFVSSGGRDLSTTIGHLPVQVHCWKEGRSVCDLVTGTLA